MLHLIVYYKYKWSEWLFAYIDLWMGPVHAVLWKCLDDKQRHILIDEEASGSDSYLPVTRMQKWNK